MKTNAADSTEVGVLSVDDREEAPPFVAILRRLLLLLLLPVFPVPLLAEEELNGVVVTAEGRDMRGITRRGCSAMTTGDTLDHKSMLGEPRVWVCIICP